MNFAKCPSVSFTKANNQTPIINPPQADQISSNNQSPITKLVWNFEHWLLFGHWNLVIGYFT